MSNAASFSGALVSSVLIPVAALSGVAHAGPVDLVGFGAPAIGRGGGGVALTDGAQTAFRNPATLQDMTASQLVLGVSLLRMQFEPVPSFWWDTNRDGFIDDSDDPLRVDVDPDPADAIWVALGRPIGSRFGIAFNAMIPVRRMLRIETFEPSLPNYFMLANRAQRFDMALSFGWEQLNGISVGGGVEVIARARYALTTTLDLSLRGAEEGDDELGALVTDIELDAHTMVLDLVPGLAPIASVHWDVGRLVPPLDGLSLGGAYRGSTGLPVDVTVDLQANVAAQDVGEAEDVGVSILVPIHLAVFDHYVPARWSMGVAWTQADLFRLYVDAYHTIWSPMPLSVAHVVDTEIQSQLLALPDPEVADGNQLQASLRNTWSTRLGGELQLPALSVGGRVEQVVFRLRAGGGWEPSPLVSQSATTALLDADRLILAGGAGIAHGDPFELVSGPVSWDLHGQVQLLGSGELPVDTTPYREGAPVYGGTIPIGGVVWATGLQWAIDY